MKKFFCMMVAVALLLCISGCTVEIPATATENPSVSPAVSSSPSFTPSPTEAPVSTPEPAPATTPEITPEPTTVPSATDKGAASDKNSFAFSDLAGLEFCFESGAGAWSTVVTIEPDGTFNGYYHDTDMGDTGKGYPNGTKYESIFSGQFSAPQKVDEYTYSMKCVSLKAEGTVNEEKIVDGEKIITSDPYGFDNADEFLLYLPGKKVSELPQMFVDWIQYSIEGDTLTSYGLYNVGGEEGFSN